MENDWRHLSGLKKQRKKNPKHIRLIIVLMVHSSLKNQSPLFLFSLIRKSHVAQGSKIIEHSWHSSVSPLTPGSSISPVALRWLQLHPPPAPFTFTVFLPLEGRQQGNHPPEHGKLNTSALLWVIWPSSHADLMSWDLSYIWIQPSNNSELLKQSRNSQLTRRRASCRFHLLNFDSRHFPTNRQNCA